MKNILDKVKGIFNNKKEVSVKELYDNMDEILSQAEQDVGGNFFPEEKLLSVDEVHYRALRLKSGADFELIQKNYARLKEKYNPELYKNDENKYNKAVELDTKLEVAYKYFKNKFKIEE